jgi:hypothetical protein
MGIDASGFGTSKLANWFQKRYGSLITGDEQAAPEAQDPAPTPAGGVPVESARRKPKEAKPGVKRLRKGFVKVHTVEGLMSGLIYALHCTLDFGEGIADPQHFVSLVRETIHGTVRLFVGDKGYWKAHHFELLDSLNALLMILKRDDVVAENAEVGREMIAFFEYLRFEHPGLYRAFYRYRQRIESAFSAQKRKTGHVRTRTRKCEMLRVNQSYPQSMESLKADIRSGRSKWTSVPRGYEAMRAFVCTVIAREAVGRAQVTEANAMAIASNIRRIVEWEMFLGEVNIATDAPFMPLRRVFVPWAA